MALTPLHDADPRRIAGMRLLGRLGAGGMGLVYLAEGVDRRFVAIKQMRAELADDPSFRSRFAREATALVTVQSRYTARVLAIDSDAARPFLVMEYVRGSSVSEQVSTDGPLSGRQLRELALGLAEALVAIHAVGVVHRDLKPSNVILGPARPRVIDFGIAQIADAVALTGTGFAIGSPGYMAPEQLTGQAGSAADVFSWALTVLYAATGRPPLGTGPAVALAHRAAHDTLDTSTLPQDLRAVIDAALAQDPDARPTAAELVEGMTTDHEGPEVAGASRSPRRTTPTGTRLATRLSGAFRTHHRRDTVMILVGITIVVLIAGATAQIMRPPPTASDATVNSGAARLPVAQRTAEEQAAQLAKASDIAKQVDSQRTSAAQLATGIREQVGIAPDDVSCPPAPAAVGASVRCQVQLHGQRVAFTATTTSAGGAVRFAPSGFVIARQVANGMTQQLAQQFRVPTTVTCNSGGRAFVIGPPGTTFTCIAARTDNPSSASAYVVTITDGQGHASFRPARR